MAGVGAIATGIFLFALGVFLLWVLVYGSGLVRPKVQTEPVTGAAHSSAASGSRSSYRKNRPRS